MATIPAAGHISNSARTQTEVKSDLDDLIASLRQVPGAAQAPLSVTIATGSITPAGSGGFLTVDTEASAATDDLTNIVTTNYPDGSCLVLRNNNAARFVVLKHLAGGAGQFNLDRAVDYTLDDTKKFILLQRRSADWYEILRGPRRMVSMTSAQSSTFSVNLEDLGKTFLCSNTITVNLLAAGTAGNGFVITVKNTGTGVVTLDGNASETIDGATTVAVTAGWTYRIACDATGWTTIASNGPQPGPNPIVNAAMEIWQRGTTFTTPTGTTGPTADQWWGSVSGAGAFTINRSTNVPTVSQAGQLFNYSLEVDVTTADASIAASDQYAIFQVLEGFVWRQFAQRQITVSFWVMSSKTGIHSFSLQNQQTADRSYVAEYTINAADTWEYKTITITASPSAGTWNYTTGFGVCLRWSLAQGSTFTTSSLNTWLTAGAAAAVASTNQVNVMDSTTNFFRLTAVKLEAGSVATPLEYLPYELDLLQCLRYYQKSFNYGTAPAQNAGQTASYQVSAPATGTSRIAEQIQYPTSVRTGSLTGTYYNPSAANAQARNITDAADDSGTSNFDGASENCLIVTITPNAANTVGDVHAVHWSIDAVRNDFAAL